MNIPIWVVFIFKYYDAYSFIRYLDLNVNGKIFLTGFGYNFELVGIYR